MASDTPGETAVSVNLPESLSRWLDEKAGEEGRSREDVLLQLLSAYRKVEGLEGGDVDPPAGMGFDGLDELPEGLRRELDARIEERVEDRLAERDPEGASDAVDADELDRRLREVESRYVELLEDVRDRVVQVKREADGKAPDDHDHPELAATIADLEETVANLETVTDGLAAQVDAGFDNYEDVLEYLADAIDRVSARQTTLAKALVETRDELRTLAARDTARSAVESLKREANQQGVRKAACGECEAPVDVALLTRAECPHCSAPFDGVEPASGFFGSDRLATGDRPALEAGDHEAGDGFEYGVDDIIDAEDAERPSVGVDDAEGDER